jgi:hypothetical protein
VQSVLVDWTRRYINISKQHDKFNLGFYFSL